MTRILLLISLLSPTLLFAGNDNFPVGARSAGMAHASVTLTDIWAIHHNQAGLALLDGATGSVYYENRFMLKEMGLSSAAFALPTKTGTFGIVYHHFGYQAYSDSKFGLAYGRKLGEKLCVGMQLNYHTLRLGDVYGTKSSVTAELGFRLKLTDQLTLGAHVFNLNRAKIATATLPEYAPTIMRLGMDYTFSKKIFVAMEAQKDIDHPLVFKTGLEYKIIDVLALRAGISTNPVLNTFGFGLYLKNFTMDIAASYHQVLGFSPQVSLSYKFSKTLLTEEK